MKPPSSPTGTARQPRAWAASLAALLAVALIVSCGSGGSGSPHPGPRRQMLRDLAEKVIVPSYEQLTMEAAALAAAAAQLEASPDAAALAAAQVAWRRTRSVWKQSEAFAIGPVETLRTAAAIDWSPVRPDRIEPIISGSDALTATYVGNLGANVKGFLALEYLLFDPSGGNEAIVQALVDVPRRGQLLRALADNLRDETVQLRDAWLPGVGDFATEFGNAGPGNAMFPTVKSAVDKVVNQLVFLSEEVADAQLFAALGRNSGVPRPEALDAHRSQNGLADVLDNLAGIQNVYFGQYSGRQGDGFNGIVETISPPAAGILSLAIQRSLETASRIPPPLEQAVTTEPALVERAQVRAKELMGRLEIDLVSTLGTTLRFNPSDGD